MKAPSDAKRAQRYAAVLVRWVLVGAVVFGLTVATGYYIINHVLAKVYTASTVLQLPAGDLATPTGSNPAPVAFQPEFLTTMMSPELLLAVVKELDLEKEWAKRLHNADGEELPDVDALTRMARLVQIAIEPRTNQVKITAASDVPREAADIANAIAAHYQAARNPQGSFGLSMGSATNPVRIIERATVPTMPSKPRTKLDLAITLVAALVLSLLVASFVEMIFLFVRASEREAN